MQLSHFISLALWACGADHIINSGSPQQGHGVSLVIIVENLML